MSFELATTVFKDPFAIERLADREEDGEERFVIIGLAEGPVLLLVAYTERESPPPARRSAEAAVIRVGSLAFIPSWIGKRPVAYRWNDNGQDRLQIRGRVHCRAA